MQLAEKMGLGMGDALCDYAQMRCQNEAPFPILEMALEKVVNRGRSLDIGSGALLEVRRMIEECFQHITVIDQLCNDELHNFDPHIVSFEQCLVEDYKFSPDSFDFVSALFVLPFMQRKELSRVMDDIVSSLKKDGIFVATFFGENDFRARDARVITLSESEINYLVRDLHILRIHEFEGPGNIFGEEERVHVYRYITKK